MNYKFNYTTLNTIFTMLKALLKFNYLYLLCCFPLFSLANDVNKLPTNAQYGFIENKGQFVNQFYEANNEVLYVLDRGNFKVQLRKDGFSYEVIDYQFKKNENLKFNQPFAPHLKITDTCKIVLNIQRIDFTFHNHSPELSVLSHYQNADVLNYYLAHTPEQGITGVKHFNKIVYKNVYNGIDIEFLVSEQTNLNILGFKYNIIVHPNGDLDNLRLRLKADSNSSVSLTSQGNLIIPLFNKHLIESIPYSYVEDANGIQTGVKATFIKISDSLFGINVSEKHKIKGKLIIDPVPWAFYYGSGGYGTSLTTDNNNNILLAGYTINPIAMATNGTHQLTLAGSNDTYIAKFNQNGQRVWGTYYGGTKEDECKTITTDIAGNIIIAGQTSSTSGIATTGAFIDTTVYGGIFIAKFNPNGIRLWGTYYGSCNSWCSTGNMSNQEGDVANSTITDIQGNIYITGSARGLMNGFASSGAHQQSFGGVQDAFIVKFNPSGNRIWATYYGGTGFDVGYDINIHQNRFIYLTGSTGSAANITFGNVQQNVYGGGSNDAFIVKFDTAGARIWGTYFGGTGADVFYKMDISDSNDIYLAGGTSSLNMASVGAFKTTYGGSLYACFDTTGIRLWSTYYGASSFDGSLSCVADKQNDLIVAGSAHSINANIATPNSHMPNAAANTGTATNLVDIFVAKFNRQGQRLWGTYYGSTGTDAAYAVTTDTNNSIFITGWTSSPQNIATTGSFQTQIFGNTSPFLAAFTPNGDLVQVRNNHLTSNQTICARSAPDTIFGALPLGVMVGNFSYRWISSVSDSVSGFAPAAGNNSSQHYKPGNLTQTTWYRRIVISANKADTSHAIQITVLSKPQAAFAVNNPGQCLTGNSFTFTDTSIFSGSYQRFWNLGTGINDTSSLPVVNKTYQAIGAYQVKLLLINPDGCNDSIIRIVSVGNKPQAAFTVNNSQQCQNNNTFIFSNQSSVSSGPLQYRWQFSAQLNDTSSLSAPNKTYLQHGAYTVKLIANSWGCTDTTSTNITVLPKPIAGFTQNSLTQCFKNNRFEFADTSLQNGAGLLTRNWRFSTKLNDTSTLQNPVKSFDTLGVFNVRLISLAQNGCRDTVVKNVNVLLTPIPAITNYTNNTQELNNNSFRFAIGGMFWSYNSYSWDLGDTLHGQTWNNQVTRVYSFSSAYTIKLFAHNNNGCSDTAFFNIKILPNTPTTQATNLTFSNITNTALRVNWINGNGAQRMVIARPNAPVNINPVNGIGYIANAIYGQGSNLGNGNFVVYKGTNNFVNVSGLNPLTAYHFAVFEFNGDSNLSSYRIPGLTSNQTTLPVTWLNFAAKLVDNNTVNLSWQTASEINNSGFKIERSFNTFNFEEIGFVKGNGTTNAISSYRFTDNDISQAKNKKFNTIYYRLKQTDFDGSYHYSKLVSVSLIDNFISDIKLFPNPNNGCFNILLPDNYLLTNNTPVISIFDILGNLVQTEYLTDTNQLIKLNKIAKGLYFVNIRLDNENFNTKILVE
ncbi:MAG: PKD domain-containing protein [Bacteroidia bacterium]